MKEKRKAMNLNYAISAELHDEIQAVLKDIKNTTELELKMADLVRCAIRQYITRHNERKAGTP